MQVFKFLFLTLNHSIQLHSHFKYAVSTRMPLVPAFMDGEDIREHSCRYHHRKFYWVIQVGPGTFTIIPDPVLVTLHTLCLNI